MDAKCHLRTYSLQNWCQRETFTHPESLLLTAEHSPNWRIPLPGRRGFVYQMQRSFHLERHWSDPQSNQTAQGLSPSLCFHAFLTVGDWNMQLQTVLYFSEREFQHFHFSSTFQWLCSFTQSHM